MFTISRELAALFRRVEALFKNDRASQGLKILEEVRERLEGSDAVVSFIVEGDSFSSMRRWDEARECYKKVLLLAKRLDLTDKKEKLRRLATSYFRAFFFSVEEEQAFRTILAISHKSPFNRPFLLELASILQEQKDWFREVQLWDIILSRSSKENYQNGLLGKGVALTKSHLFPEAKGCFYAALRKKPDFFGPYQWLGGLYLVEGRDKAFYFLRKGWNLGRGEQGSRELGFCRNVFIALIIQANYGKSEEPLAPLAEEQERACELIGVCLMNIPPSFWNMFMGNFTTFASFIREPKKRTPRKHLRLVDGIEKVVEALGLKQRRLREYLFPLAKEYWGVDPEGLARLSYHACLEILFPYSERESEAFIQNYGNAIDEESYRSFVSILKERKILVGFLLLTFSVFLDLLADVLEESGKNLENLIRFDINQEEPYRYERGSITFGSGSFQIDDPETFREVLRKRIMEGK